nr:hypothetical protein [Blastocatellia bacterium]
MKPQTDQFSFFRKAISLYLLATFVLTNGAAVQTLAVNPAETDRTATPFLTFTTDLTQLGREGRLRQSPSFETEIAQVLDVLEKGGSRHPVLVDEDGSVQDEIVEQIAIRIAKGSVPDSMRDRSLIKLETTTLFSFAVDAAKLDAAVASVLEKVLSTKGRSVLFVDDVSAFVKAGSENSEFVTAIRNQKLRLIGGSSRAAYQEKIAVSSDLADLFEVITVRAPKTAGSEVGDTSGEGYIGDNVSPDLRQMMADDPTGTKRVDVILQAKAGNNASLRALLNSGEG